VLSEDLGCVNLRRELYMYVYAGCDLLMIFLLMILIDMRWVDVYDNVDLENDVVIEDDIDNNW